MPSEHPIHILKMIKGNFELIETLDPFSITLTAMNRALQDLITLRAQSGFLPEEEEVLARTIDACCTAWIDRHNSSAIQRCSKNGDTEVFQRIDLSTSLARLAAQRCMRNTYYRETIFFCSSLIMADPKDSITYPSGTFDAQMSRPAVAEPIITAPVESLRSPIFNNAFSFTTEGEPIHNSPVPPTASVPQGLTRNETVGASALSRMSISSASSSNSRPSTPSGLVRNATVGATALSRMTLSSFSEGIPGATIAEGRSATRSPRPASRSGSRRNSIRDGSKAKVSRRANKENIA
ncbi:hypothetical protein SCHPADRAFT_936752 [Schizopora paradoxa]|uniref:Uncharacterized protein n=1 Tax=Schizopora paradoxa TaxID=27342 RepID=A0A0H2SKW0_9AGAM|nr:hypothetical protein SCHPADRAFT_936752 [Schizopora paradoxa]